jgi:hypothetical protein
MEDAREGSGCKRFRKPSAGSKPIRLQAQLPRGRTSAPSTAWLSIGCHAPIWWTPANENELERMSTDHRRRF